MKLFVDNLLARVITSAIIIMPAWNGAYTIPPYIKQIIKTNSQHTCPHRPSGGGLCFKDI